MNDKAQKKQRLAKQAISLAMQGQWEEAVRINKAMLALFPSDVEAHNRLGRALLGMGEHLQAREAYERSLQLDHHNSIASKNLQRLSLLGDEVPIRRSEDHMADLDLYTKESGKTATVTLVSPAKEDVLAKMSTGDEVYLHIESQRLIVQDSLEIYLGQIEPKHELRLLELIGEGNKYAAAIASLEHTEVKIIIREIYQHPSLADRISFPPSKLDSSGFGMAINIANENELGLDADDLGDVRSDDEEPDNEQNLRMNIDDDDNDNDTDDD